MKRTLDPAEKLRRQQWRDIVWLDNKELIALQEKEKSLMSVEVPSRRRKNKHMTVGLMATMVAS